MGLQQGGAAGGLDAARCSAVQAAPGRQGQMTRYNPPLSLYLSCAGGWTPGPVSGPISQRKSL